MSWSTGEKESIVAQHGYHNATLQQRFCCYFKFTFFVIFFGCGNNVTKYDNSKNVIFRDSLFHPV